MNIDWKKTKKETGLDKGYFSNFPQSNKKIFAICINCGCERQLKFRDYNDLCHKCALKKLSKNPEWKIIMKEWYKNPEWRKNHITAMEKVIKDKEWRKNHITAMEKRSKTTEWQEKQKIAGKKRSEDPTFSKRISAGLQGIPYEEWENFAVEKLYCPAFNEECKESNREKYDRKCFICGLPEEENITNTGKQWRLSVHHVDMDKGQGCDGKRWKLIPLCLHHHNRTIHTKLWEDRIIWLLNNVWNGKS